MCLRRFLANDMTCSQVKLPESVEVNSAQHYQFRCMNKEWLLLNCMTQLLGHRSADKNRQQMIWNRFCIRDCSRRQPLFLVNKIEGVISHVNFHCFRVPSTGKRLMERLFHGLVLKWSFRCTKLESTSSWNSP